MRRWTMPVWAAIAFLVITIVLSKLSQAQEIPDRIRYADIKFTCGVITNNTSPVVIGRYATTITIYRVPPYWPPLPRMSINASLTIPYRTYVNTPDPSTLITWVGYWDLVAPDTEMELSFDCVDLANMYTQTNPGATLPSFAEGHFEINTWNYEWWNDYHRTPGGMPPDFSVVVTYTVRPEAGTNNGVQSIQTIHIPNVVVEIPNIL